ncbi:hypothetical protein PoB_003791700 [Plakobranchus ocellatus]|uniref:Uncharacterized protein n=1 Tax=Plakobranchus ocellatus TaxID=259542 RepID=A0AAV4AWJ1_9GAST|nr:hypothetical protein PoB_003791700 [Plakobranchus ocellatus]
MGRAQTCHTRRSQIQGASVYGQGASGGTRTRDRRAPGRTPDLRADSLATVPPTPLGAGGGREGDALVAQRMVNLAQKPHCRGFEADT